MIVNVRKEHNKTEHYFETLKNLKRKILYSLFPSVGVPTR